MNGKNYSKAVKDHSGKPDDKLIHKTFAEYKKRNITFIRDGGDYLHVSERAKEIAPDYGIDYRTPLYAIHKNGEYGAIVGRGFDTIAEYEKLVDEVIAGGGDFIKIMTTGIMDFDTYGVITGTPLEFELVQEMVAIAHDKGLSVMSHTNGAKPVLDAVEAGVDSIEHGNYIDKDAIDAMAEKKCIYIPTATVARNLIGSGIGNNKVLSSIWKASKSTIQKAYDAGVVLALGSDAGAVGVLHGQGLIDEYACFTSALPDVSDLNTRLVEGLTKIKSLF